MKIIGTTFEKLPRERLVIGFEGENLRATVRIDCASVFAEYPNATPALIVKPLFADAYPVVVDRNGTDVDWLITSEILSFSGDGEIQLVFYKDEVICKSAVSKIRVCRSLQVTGDMPDPVAQWIDDANRKLAEVDAQIVELEGMVDTATDAATRAEQSASTASTKAEQAAGSAATATEKATEATNAAGTATAKAAEAALSATQASNSATSAANSESVATAKAAEAAQSAQTAAQKAEQITEAAQIATGKAEEASASATAAQESATDAASSATAASASETAAKASETAAGASATQAAQSAHGASTAAQTATQKAGEAATSATNAAASATNAATSAETASTKAGEAAQSAQAVAETAEQLAGSLEQIDQNTQDIADHEQYAEATYATKTDLYKKADVIKNTASGAIASFTDGAEMPVDDVTAQINPVQDLHGYDHPWPAGGGVNKFAIADAVGVYPSTGATYGLTITLDNIAETIRIQGTPTWGDTTSSVTFRCVSTQSGSYYGDAPVTHDYSGMAYKIFPISLSSNVSAITELSISRGMITVTLAKTGTAAIDVLFKIVIATAGTTIGEWTPYSNICPITGHTGVTVMRAGKNMINPSELVYSANNVWYGIHLPPDTDFVFSTDSAITGLYVAYSDDDEMPSISGTGWTDITYKYNTTSLRFNSGSHKWYRLMTYEINGVIRDKLYQLELGTTATDYEPYQGETYDIAFPSEAGTVYGGSLTIAEDGSGVLTVKGRLDTITVENNEIVSSLFNWPSGGTPTILTDCVRMAFNRNSQSSNMQTTSSNYEYKQCNYLQHAFNYNLDVPHWYINNQLYVYLPVSAVDTTKESWVSYFTEHPLIIYVPYANPIVYSLTAEQITTLLGQNNLWHDANGEITVGYKANTKLYIDGKIAELVAQIVNS